MLASWPSAFHHHGHDGNEGWRIGTVLNNPSRALQSRAQKLRTSSTTTPKAISWPSLTSWTRSPKRNSEDPFYSCYPLHYWSQPGFAAANALLKLGFRELAPPFQPIGSPKPTLPYNRPVRTSMTPACGVSSQDPLNLNHRWIFRRDRHAPQHLKPRRDHFSSQIFLVPPPPILRVLFLTSDFCLTLAAWFFFSFVVPLVLTLLVQLP